RRRRGRSSIATARPRSPPPRRSPRPSARAAPPRRSNATRSYPRPYKKSTRPRGPPMPVDPITLLRPRRTITGISAVLLPFTGAGDIDWPGFTAHVLRTAGAGLTPAVNMDTGFGNLLAAADKAEVLDATRSALAGRPFVAGAFVS